MPEAPKTTCAHCGKRIALIQTGVRTWKWVDGRMGWHCGSDPAFPTRAHAPGSEYVHPVREPLTQKFPDGSE